MQEELKCSWQWLLSSASPGMGRAVASHPETSHSGFISLFILPFARFVFLELGKMDVVMGTHL